MIRVLHVIASFSGGGAERQIALLMRALSERRLDVHVAFMQEGPNFNLARSSGASLHRLQVGGNYDPRTFGQLIRLLNRTVRPLVVQTWLLHADLFGGTSARLSGIPWVLSERASGAMYRKGVKNAARRWLGLGADAVVANSGAGLDYWLQSGFRGEARVIRNIVQHGGDCGSVRAGELPGGIGSNAILVVGRLEEEKNPLGVLGVLGRLLEQMPTARAHFLGVGSMEGALRGTVEQSPALRDKVLFHGYVSDITPWLRRAGCIFSYSRHEGTPNVVLEAVAQGCPAVVSDIPAHLELLDPAAAWIAPLDDARAAAAALRAALSDREEADRRATNARKVLALFEASGIAREYEELYRLLVDRRSTGAGGVP